MKKSTREWVKKAEDDYQLAVDIARGGKPFHDQRCHHCQQSAEKYRKANLEERGLSIPKTHDFEDLLALLLPYHPTLRTLRRGLKFLSNFAVAVRYPGEDATRRQAEAALRWAGRVRDACRTLLGVEPRRQRRRKAR